MDRAFEVLVSWYLLRFAGFVSAVVALQYMIGSTGQNMANHPNYYALCEVLPQPTEETARCDSASARLAVQALFVS